MSNSIHSLYKDIVLKLKALYPENEARAMGDRLFEYYFGIKPMQRVILGSVSPDPDKILLIDEAVTKLLSIVPLQYVLGTAWFMGLEFSVNQSVLIPRPETEELVSLILKAYQDKKTDQKLRILDIGAGSGCIAISLKHFLPGSVITAVDISHEAISLANANAVKNNAEINFVQVDILDRTQWYLLPQCDLIVSNPPYVTHSEKRLMLPNVLDYEPHDALFVPDNDPLIFYRCIMDLANAKLSRQGSLWFEINEMYGNELRNIALDQDYKQVNIFFDIHKKERFLQATNEFSS